VGFWDWLFGRRVRDRRILAGDAPWRQVRPQLRPVLRAASMGGGLTSEQRPLRRPAMPYLAEMVVIDQPSSMLYVRHDRLADWGVTADEVFAAARDNLARRAPRPAGTPPDGPVMLRFVEDGDAYWSSCLLVDGWLASLTERVGGRPVAFVPDRETLLVVADEPGVIEKLFDMVEADYLAATRAVSPVPYVSDTNGRTVPYDAPPGHPLHQPVRRAERVLAVQEYAQQRTLYSGRHAGAELAELSLSARRDGSTFTVTTWPRAGAALLPHADFVTFASAEDRQFHVPWAEVVEHAPPRAVPDLDPVRYAVNGWPHGETLACLRAARVAP